MLVRLVRDDTGTLKILQVPSKLLSGIPSPFASCSMAVHFLPALISAAHLRLQPMDPFLKVLKPTPRTFRNRCN